MDHDLIIIGGGLAGLTAANRASELGLRPVVLEQGSDERYPCNSRFAGGLVHVVFKDMARDAEALHDAIEGVTGGLTDEGLTRLLAEESPRAIDWMRDQGAKFIKAGPQEWMRWVLAPPRPRAPGLNWQGRGPDVLLRTLTANLATRQGRVLRGVRADRLLIEDGRVAGVTAIQDGAETALRAPVVVIADGGYHNNEALVRDHICKTPDALFRRNAGTGHGDGVAMARQAGARLIDMEHFYGHLLGREVFENEKLWPYPILDHAAGSGVLVDANAKRYCDEGISGVYMANETARLPDPRGIVVVFDEEIWTTVAADQSYPPTINDTFIRAGGTVLEASTIAELAVLAGLPADTLQETVDAHNAALETDTLGDLSPVRSNARGNARSIVKPPFRAILACAGITYTFGGIAIDRNARTLDASGTPIPGLYAVGSCSAGAEGGPRAAYIGGLSKAVITGLCAAEHIAGNK